MKLKHEIFIVKIIALTTILITLWEFSALGATRASISRLFMRYNRNLSQKQADYFTDLTFDAGAEYHVSPALITAIIVCESSARQRVICKTGDYSLMQIHYNVH